MKKFAGLIALLVVTTLTTASAQAAAYGSSILLITGAKLQKQLGNGTWVDATVSTGVAANRLGDLTVTSNSVTSDAFASFNGVDDSNTGVPGFDAPQAFVSSPLLAAPGENTFSAVGGLPAFASGFARADTNGGGQLLIPKIPVGTPVVNPTPASVSTIAELKSINNFVGSAFGNVGGQTQFSVRVNTVANYRMIFNATIDLKATGNGFAEASYSIKVNGPPKHLIIFQPN